MYKLFADNVSALTTSAIPPGYTGLYGVYVETGKGALFPDPYSLNARKQKIIVTLTQGSGIETVWQDGVLSSISGDHLYIYFTSNSLNWPIGSKVGIRFNAEFLNTIQQVPRSYVAFPYTLTAADAGAELWLTAGGTQQVLIPDNSFDSFDIGSRVTLINTTGTVMAVKYTSAGYVNSLHSRLGDGIRAVPAYGKAELRVMEDTSMMITGDLAA